MKRFIVFLVLLVWFLTSCVSIQDSRMGPNDSQLEVLGEVKVMFHSFQPFHIIIKPAIKATAYKRLLEAAKIQYGLEYGANEIDVKNINIKFYDFSLATSIITAATLGVFGIIANGQELEARGTVVLNPNKAAPNEIKNINSLENAIEKIAETFVGRLPKGSTIAVLSISGTNNAGQIIDELEFRLVEKGTELRVVERRLLAQIRLEQGFQMTGEVSDESAVSIGNLLGANIVITGNISRSGNMQRLTLKALDVKTAHIVAMAREGF